MSAAEPRGEYPVESFGEEIKEEGGRGEAEGQASLLVRGALPVKAEEPTVFQGDGDIAKGIAHVPFHDDGAPASNDDKVEDLAYRHVHEVADGFVNVRIDRLGVRVREVVDAPESPRCLRDEAEG